MSDHSNSDGSNRRPGDALPRRLTPSYVGRIDSSVPSQHERESGQLPTVRARWFQKKEAALRELAREIEAAREVIRQRTGLYGDQAALIGAIVDLESARAEAEMRADARIQAHQLQAQLVRDEAAYQRLSAEIERERLKDEQEQQRANAKQRTQLRPGQLAVEQERRGSRVRRVAFEAQAPPA